MEQDFVQSQGSLSAAQLNEQLRERGVPLPPEDRKELEKQARDGIPGAEGQFHCEYCDPPMHFSTSQEMARHIKVKHPDKTKKALKEQERQAQIEAAKPPTDEQVYAAIKLQGPEALAEVMRKRLAELLDAPNITEGSKEYALKEWDEDPSLHFNFQALGRMLAEDAGVTAPKALRIVDKLYPILQKYQPALQQAGFSLPFYPGGQAMGAQNQGWSQYPQQPQQWGQVGWPQQQPQWGQPGPYQQGPQGYYGPPPSPYGQQPVQPMTEEKVARLVTDSLEKVKKDLVEELRPPPPHDEGLVEVEIPIAINEDGSPVMMKTRAAPSMVPMLMMGATGRQQPQARGMDDDKLRQFAKDITAPYDAQLKEIKDELKEAQKDAQASREKVLAVQLEGTREQVKAMRDDQAKLIDSVDRSRSSAASSGFQNDSFRLVGQGMDKLERLFNGRHPLDKIVDKVIPSMPPPQLETVDGETADVTGQLNGLSQTGAVVDQ